MPRLTNQFAAMAAAFLIMASSFGAVITVPPAQASFAIAVPALA